jgi:hypothetical protein
MKYHTGFGSAGAHLAIPMVDKVSSALAAHTHTSLDQLFAYHALSRLVTSCHLVISPIQHMFQSACILGVDQYFLHGSDQRLTMQPAIALVVRLTDKWVMHACMHVCKAGESASDQPRTKARLDVRRSVAALSMSWFLDEWVEAVKVSESSLQGIK